MRKKGPWPLPECCEISLVNSGKIRLFPSDKDCVSISWNKLISQGLFPVWNIMNYRMGLDVGTNSLGWSVIELDENGNPCRIEAAGVRIFSNGRKPKGQSTLKAERRVARSVRRRRDRFKQRQKFLVHALQKNQLFPKDKSAMRDLQKLNPIELRTKALTEKLLPHHIGRTLFHLNQRRGFKSNRKDRSEESTSGKVSSSFRFLLQEMKLIGPPLSKNEYKNLSLNEQREIRQKEAENRKRALKKLSKQRNLTYGSFLWERQQSQLHTRVRDGAGDTGKLYDIYPQRELYEDEFDKIWSFQSKHYPHFMSNEAKEYIKNAIFHQRSLRPRIVGQCTYLPEEKRTFRGMPSFQRYRIYQEVNNLEWMAAGGEIIRLVEHPNARNRTVDLLEQVTTKNGQVVWSKIKNVLKNSGVARGNFQFNLETPKRKGLDGNLTSKIMRNENCIGSDWDKWPLEKQDKFVYTIIGEKVCDHGQERYLTDDEVLERLQKEFGLSEYTARECLNASHEIPDSTAGLSLKAARILTEKMKQKMFVQSKAVEDAAKENEKFKNPLIRVRDGNLLPNLPYYGEAFQDGRHIIPGLRDEKERHDDLKYFGGVTNPTVHVALNQIRQVVNELIRDYGHPHSIAIELGRKLPAGEKKLKEMESKQKKNHEENAQLDKELQEQNIAINFDNRLRLRLWKELDNHGPRGCRCPFSGEVIGIADLFNGNAEIEYLIPFNISLDDSRANKVLCTRQANKDKGKRTPYDAFCNQPNYDWNEILEASKRLPKAKQWRFQKDALKIWQRDHQDFLARHLNDTRYIGRLAKEYLEYICPHNKIDILTGKLTAFLRKHWGLNSVLNDENPQKKNRDDYRHHAVDAIVVGMTKLSTLQMVSKAADQSINLEFLFGKRKNKKGPIDPWSSFRSEVKTIVQNILVSHKPKRRKLVEGTTDGQLHNSTAFGIIKYRENGPSVVVTRKSIDTFTKKEHVESIRDRYLREKFLCAFNQDGKEGVKNLAESKHIRSLRCRENQTVIPIKNKDGVPYKAYAGDSNWGMEIYQLPNEDEWKGVAISRFNANQSSFIPGQSYKPHPAARLVMRLQIDDCIEIQEDSRKKIMRLQKLSQNGQLAFSEIHEANVDYRTRKKTFRYLLKTINTLKVLDPRKVHISPAGKMSYEIRK